MNNLVCWVPRVRSIRGWRSFPPTLFYCLFSFLCGVCCCMACYSWENFSTWHFQFFGWSGFYVKRLSRVKYGCKSGMSGELDAGPLTLTWKIGTVIGVESYPHKCLIVEQFYSYWSYICNADFCFRFINWITFPLNGIVSSLCEWFLQIYIVKFSKWGKKILFLMNKRAFVCNLVNGRRGWN